MTTAPIPARESTGLTPATEVKFIMSSGRDSRRINSLVISLTVLFHAKPGRPECEILPLKIALELTKVL